MTDPSWWSDGWRESFPEGIRLSVIVPVYNERYLVAELLRQLLEVEVERIAELEIIVVDDGSTDGSAEIVERIAASQPDRIRFIRKPENDGKGAALREGVARSTGDLVVFQDADLEYDPRDFGRLVRPFWEDGADVVYGSRFAAAERRRVLYYRHSLGNRLITFLSNLTTDLNLTDVETCYKMFRGPLLRSIPLRSNDFRTEIEVTAKVAKRNCSIFEVPISYRGRTYAEGKKIGWTDGVKALWAILKYWLVDDLYQDDAYGGHLLHQVERVRRFHRWMAKAIRPWVGDRVLEIGAGIGNLTGNLIPRDLYVASDVNDGYLHYLTNLAAGKPYLKTARVDLEDDATFAEHQERYDTAIAVSVLEHVAEPGAALARLNGALERGGRLVLYVPRGPWLLSPLDEALGQLRRYTRTTIRAELDAAGFEVEHVAHFNKLSLVAWLVNGKILRRKRFGRLQLKIFDLMVPMLRYVDRFLPWKGLGLIVVGRKR